MLGEESRVPGSFRDPSGFVFRKDGLHHRLVLAPGARDYDLLMSSGLYEVLSTSGRLVSHEELPHDASSGAHRLLLPQQIPFVSYPFEWCFGQLRAAALLTLDLQQTAIEHGLVLRDASAYNVQFLGSRPVFMDTLSFGAYTEGEPWVAYGQFCRHFLAPLLLMARVDAGLGKLLEVHLDGVPLPLASRLLPWGSWLRMGELIHLHLHARSTVRHADDAGDVVASRRSSGGMSKLGLLGLIDTLRGVIQRLDWAPRGTEWAEYYAHTTYTSASHEHKAQLVREYLGRVQQLGKLDTVWDLGANTGRFSAVAAELAPHVMSFDVDLAAVERHYRAVSAARSEGILPLVQDLTNPSRGMGWDGTERSSLQSRGPADAVLALALVHHLALSNNVPLPLIARFLRAVGRFVIIEFVPRADPQVKKLLATRPDVFPDYTPEGFEAAMGASFEILARTPLRESERVLYLLGPR
jgi:SAM-dependent methyltransferase